MRKNLFFKRILISLNENTDLNSKERKKGRKDEMKEGMKEEGKHLNN